MSNLPSLAFRGIVCAAILSSRFENIAAVVREPNPRNPSWDFYSYKSSTIVRAGSTAVFGGSRAFSAILIVPGITSSDS